MKHIRVSISLSAPCKNVQKIFTCSLATNKVYRSVHLRAKKKQRSSTIYVTNDENLPLE